MTGAEGIFEWPDKTALLRTVVRLASATVLGAAIGFEREVTGKAAGLRTHMLVALASAVFILAALEAGMGPGDVGFIIHGVASGIGFIGAGAILKLDTDKQIHGLTTAGTIWLTAATGVAAGLGRIWLAGIAVIMALVVLRVAQRLGEEGKLPGASGSKH
jgi:putative Mg2+ transporter-C (MgtC) family protein